MTSDGKFSIDSDDMELAGEMIQDLCDNLQVVYRNVSLIFMSVPVRCVELYDTALIVITIYFHFNGWIHVLSQVQELDIMSAEYPHEMASFQEVKIVHGKHIEKLLLDLYFVFGKLLD